MQKVYVAGAAVLSVLLVALVVAILWAMGSAAGDRDRFSSLEMAPHDSVVLIAINTKPDSSQWIGFTKTLDLIDAKDPLANAIDDFLADFDLIWQDDILPLAGDEAYFAITDIEKVEAGEGMFAGIRVTDIDRARDVFLTIEEEEGAELSSTEYKGVEILYTDAPTLDELSDESPSAAAFLEDVMLLAGTPNEIEGAIDIVMGDAPNAAQNERLMELADRESDDFLAWGFVDMSLLWDDIEAELEIPETSDDVDVGTEFIDDAREAADRLSFSISTRAQGIVLDFNVFHSDGYVPDEQPAFGKEFETRLADRVPADTLFFFAGYDLYNQIYVPARDNFDELSLGEGGETFDDLIEEIETEAGFHFEDDLLALLDREFAVAVNVSDLEAETPELEHLMALFEVEDGGTIYDTMIDLGDYLERIEAIDAEETERGGIHRWAEFGGDGDAAGWTVDDDILAIGYPEQSIVDFVDRTGESLADTEDWQRTVGLLPDRATSFMFVSVARLLDEVRSMEGAQADFEEAFDGEITLDDLEPIRSIGMSGANIDGGWQARVVVLVTD